MTTGWKRPSGPLNVWRIVDGYEISEDGSRKPVKFSVQDVPDVPERRQEVIDLFINHFMDDEPMCKSLEMKKDPDGLEDFKTMWNYGMDQGATVGCYKLDAKGNISKLVGANAVFMITNETSKEMAVLKNNFKSEKFKTIWKFFESMLEKADFKNVYKDVDRYISSICLVVHSAYRRQKLAFHMLDVRREIGKKYGFGATYTMFSVPGSQMPAKQAGFQDVCSIDFKDAVDHEGKPIFPNAELMSKCVKLMMRRLP